MVGFRVRVDVHVTIAQIDFFVSLGSLIAAGSPFVAGLVFELLGFNAFKGIFENERSEVMGPRIG